MEEKILSAIGQTRDGTASVTDEALLALLPRHHVQVRQVQDGEVLQRLGQIGHSHIGFFIMNGVVEGEIPGGEAGQRQQQYHRQTDEKIASPMGLLGKNIALTAHGFLRWPVDRHGFAILL